MAQATARGQVVCEGDSGHVFNGGENLEVSVMDCSLMDTAATILGEQKVQLSAGQTFPISFEFPFDQSRAGRGFGGRNITASIRDGDNQLLYMCTVGIEESDGVHIPLEKYKKYGEA